MKEQKSEVRGRRSCEPGRPDSGIVRSSPAIRRGFTMLEIMIVVGIIVILVGIVLAVGATLAASQNIKRTEATMQILESALDEWEALMRRDLTWGIDGVPSNPPYESRYDMQEDTMHIFLVSDMLDDVSRSSDIRSMLANIDGERYFQYDQVVDTDWLKEGAIASFQATEPDPQAGSWLAEKNANWVDKHTVLDAWDRPIRVIHPGRKWTDGDLLPLDPFSDDGTVQTPLEIVYGSAQSAKPYFVSGGPDGRFGDISAPDGTPMREATRDNIYSYELE